MNWVLVSDQVPKDSGQYLAWDGDEACEAYYSHSFKSWYRGDDGIKPTHWMPLPNPPGAV